MFKCSLVSISALIIIGCTVSNSDSSNSEEKNVVTVTKVASEKIDTKLEYHNQNQLCPEITEKKIKTCSSKGGSMVKQGRTQCYTCLVQYSDAEKSCHDSSECMGKCYTKERIPSSLKIEITGVCATNDSRFGCHQEIISGRARHVLCID